MFDTHLKTDRSKDVADGSSGLNNYGSALWWTAMLMMTMGSEYWPKTPEGRILCLVLALYAFAVFGYVTATIATFFIWYQSKRKAIAPAVIEMRSLKHKCLINQTLIDLC